MPDVPGSPVRRLIERHGATHLIVDWVSRRDHIAVLLQCGEQFDHPMHRKEGDLYWRDTHNEDDPPTCLGCIGARRGKV